jgi:predicted dehydrogenase
MHPSPNPSARLVVLDPGHFHAALLQKENYSEIDPLVYVYAPLGPELLDYLHRIQLFNTRTENPTGWRLAVHCEPDPIRALVADKPGNVAVLAGKNDAKISRIRSCVQAGLNVLADKPWIISSADLPKLDESLQIAGDSELIAYDIMTERYEITSQIQRELVNTPAVFGDIALGSPDTPAVYARSVHNVVKLVSGVPLRRPAWFFDIRVQGEALADVGTHVVDLVQWTAFPDVALNYRTDVEVLDARRWPMLISSVEFEAVTGEKAFPPDLWLFVQDGCLHYFCNNSVHYTLRGIHVKLDITWDWQGASDLYEATFRGSQSRVEIREGRAEKFRPELYVVPNEPKAAETIFEALQKTVGLLRNRWPGLGVAIGGREARVVIPEELRIGHEAHFAQVTRQFFEYLREPSSMPSSEAPNMLAKYFTTTRGVELSRARAQS